MIPDTFAPPQTQALGRFTLAVLSPAFAEQDFEAVRASADSIRNVFGPSNDWPDANIPYAENLADLTRHEREFNERVAFAYALLDSADGGYLGCLYIKPIKSKIDQDRRKQFFGAQAFFWLSVTQNVVSEDFVLAKLQAWLATAWPFSAVAWPGRVQSWPEWEAMAQS